MVLRPRRPAGLPTLSALGALAVARNVAQHLFPVVRRVPGAEEYVAQHNLVDVSVGSARGAGSSASPFGRSICRSGGGR